MTHDDILLSIKNHCEAARISESTFGLRAVNDGKLVDRLKSGGTITLGTLQKIKDFMRCNPPSEAGHAA